ncbi:penicillin-binding transpeptidase domain-containing protein [Desulfobacula sp.]
MKENSWRIFQSGYILKKKKKTLFLKFKRILLGLMILLVLFCGVYFLSIKLPGTLPQKPVVQDSSEESGTVQLSKTQLTQIIENTKFSKTDKNIFFVNTAKANYTITSSINVFLQEYLLSLMDHLKTLTRGKPQRIALVVMEADTGKIIAMTGFDLENPEARPCLESDYPAASIFKIVTATAAIETLGYTPKTPLYFNGNKYTLYKRQLKDVKNKYTSKTSFSRAFAESINPVFGKIGKNHLGKKKLDHYAEAFGFNQVIQWELPFSSGSFKTNSSEYHLAELGCGFNHDTTISPIFGAMLISAVVNAGNLSLPSIVENVTNSDGQIIYTNKKETYKTAMLPKTAATMMQMLQETITKGTARKSFRGSSKDKILSKLVIGGKTGSLYNKKHTVKYDWFIGFGKRKNTNKKIALSIVVGHGKYIGTRASKYAQMILKQYFKKPLDKTAKL